MNHHQEVALEVFLEQTAADALLKRARKLRWMGLDDEADRTQESLQRSALSGSVLTSPRETD
jgi:hypothetical protein